MTISLRKRGLIHLQRMLPVLLIFTTRSPLLTTPTDLLIDWCFMPLSTVFQSYHGDRSHYSCLSWVSPVLGWVLKCLAQGHSHEKNPEDPVRLEPRTPGLQVKHFITGPRATLTTPKEKLFEKHCGNQHFLLFSQCFLPFQK